MAGGILSTTTMDCDMDAYIPDSYIPNEYQKLDIYKRIAAIESQEESGGYEGRAFWTGFGDVPKKVDSAAGDLRISRPWPTASYVTAVEQKGGELRLSLCMRRPRWLPERIPAAYRVLPGRTVLPADAEHPGFTYRKKGKSGAEKNADSLEIVKKVLIGIKGLIDH